ncbi:MAG: hypothetical protein RL637_1068 [Pseudomonadota bacterium]|jgi:acyl-[acyl-carrier-protein]-phospholipid O-acyltransferase/long-chain-fatty-acid--[acyl-carrier-protein] ligase
MYPWIKKFLKLILRLLYRVEVHGLEHYYQAGETVLIISNHVSFLDPLLLGVFLPDTVTFAINTHISQQIWLKPFLKFSQIFPMDPTHPLSIKALINHLKQKGKTVIFPEGRITVTGSLMKIYEGTGIIAEKSNAILLPIRVEGAQYTPFSRLKGQVRIRYFPKISLHILPPTKIHHAENTVGKQKRRQSRDQLDDIMTEMMFNTAPQYDNIFSALLAARQIHGGNHLIIEDLDRQPLNYHQLISRAWILANHFISFTKSGEYVGVLLPNSAKTVLLIVALQIHQRVPAMLNYSLGSQGVIATCHLAGLTKIISSRKFIELANLQPLIESLAQQLTVIYLEDIAAAISTKQRVFGYLQSRFLTAKSLAKTEAKQPAVILFTSGSEGSPKGVVLSHQNILSNINQVQARINFNATDTVLNFLPLFHSFGFTVGTILPILSGMRSFFYPSPLHYSIIPEIAYDINATIIFGTNTFLAGYAKKAHPYDFFKLRYVIAGAEKLQPNTRALWNDKFGIRILEGYGATETSPIAAVNTPLACQLGSVGRLMPAMQFELELIDGIESGGQLHLFGPNIMLGYLLADRPGEIIPPQSRYGLGWYDTGDIVDINEQGFVTIKGRMKRFAKIGGEMVSLTVVEQLATNTWINGLHAAVSIPDMKKGEQIILLTTEKSAQLSAMINANPGIAMIHFPKQLLIVDQIPLLGSGKINYPQIMLLLKTQYAYLFGD